MQTTAYNFGARGRPIKEAIEGWEVENALEVNVVGHAGNISNADQREVRLVFGNLPADSAGSQHRYVTYNEANVQEWTDYYTDVCTMYDVAIPTERQAALVEQLPWEGTFYNHNTDSQDPLPLWYIDRQAHTLYFASLDYSTYLDPDIVIRMLDVLLEGLPDPEARRAAAQERMLTTLSAYYAEGATVDLRNLRDEIGNSMRDLAHNEQTALTLRNALRDKQQRLDLLIEQANAADAAAQARSSWEQLATHRQIDKLRFEGHTLHIETVGLDIEHPTTGQTAYLGQFSVALNIQSGEVKLKNNDNARNGYEHPHVFMGGACFGEMGGTIMELVRAGQLLGAVEMVFVFLSSVNVRDEWGRTLAYWMEAQLPRPTIDEVIESVLV